MIGFIQQKGADTMKNTINRALVSIITVMLIGCGSSSSTVSEPKEEVPKEPELKEIELNGDNWQDYFEIKHKLGTDESHDYYRYDQLSVVIKDEYKDKLSQDNPSELSVSYTAPRSFYYATLSGDQLEIGDEIDTKTIDVSAYNGWDKQYLDALVDSCNNYLITDTVKISNDEITAGKDLFACGLLRSYTDSGGVHEDGTDEAVWGVIVPRELKTSAVKGKLYILE